MASRFVCALVLAWTALIADLPAQFTQLWQLGSDNSSSIEMESETTAGVNYYYGNGDYTSVGGINWTQGLEPLNVAINNGELDGFPQALTATKPTTNIFFNLTAAQAASMASLRLTVDLIIGAATGSSHDLEFRLNGTLLRTITAVATDRTEVISMTGGIMGAQAGPNKITITRTGGGSTNPRIQFDYIRLESDPTIRLIGSFTSNVSLVRPGQSATLSWVADPAASLSISFVGNVNANTVNGVGSISVSPSATTSYTLTATKAAQTETSTLTITWTEWNQTWKAGTDNGVSDELSHEAAADDNYYFAGDYTGVGGPNQVADEILRDDSAPNTINGNPAIGFERALTDTDTTTNVWFILPAPRATAVTKFRVTVDIIGMATASTHDLEFSLNGHVVNTLTGIFAAQTLTIEFTGIVGEPVAGPNVFSYRRTGGTPGAGQYIVFDWLGMEDAAGVMPAVSSVTTDDILGTRTLFWTGAVGKYYRIQKSEDNVTWTTLGQAFPTGGAKVTGLFFEDRITPYTDPTPFYRVLQE